MKFIILSALRQIVFIVYLIFFLCPHAFAQRQSTNNQTGWYMYFGNHHLNDKWGLHLEAQLRRAEIISKPQQLLIRTGINYYLSKSAFLTAGYAFIETYPYGDFAVKASFPEHRLWEQLQLNSQQGIFEWTSRFRLEQRFSKLPVLVGDEYKPGDAIYTNRFRILNKFSIPLSGKVIVDNSLYAAVYDEFMINFGNKVGNNIFDQNRAAISLGYKLPKLGRIELGYMYQKIFKADGIKVENNHTLMVGLTSNLPLYK